MFMQRTHGFRVALAEVLTQPMKNIYNVNKTEISAMKRATALVLSLMFAVTNSVISQNWYWQSPGMPLNKIVDVEMVNIDYGYAVADGSVILKTQDGGKSWTGITIAA